MNSNDKVVFDSHLGMEDEEQRVPELSFPITIELRSGRVDRSDRGRQRGSRNQLLTRVRKYVVRESWKEIYLKRLSK